MIHLLLQAGIAFLAGAAIGATVSYFWDDIQDWIERVFDAILDGLSRAIEWATERVAFLLKEGGKIYRGIIVLVRNKWGEEKIEHHAEEISPDQIPDDIKRELREGMAKLIAQQSYRR